MSVSCLIDMEDLVQYFTCESGGGVLFMPPIFVVFLSLWPIVYIKKRRRGREPRGEVEEGKFVPAMALCNLFLVHHLNKI